MMDGIKRRCPICGSICGEVLYTHNLELPELLEFMPASLDVVCCAGCGMIYTSSEANQDTYNRYYNTLHAYSLNKITHTEEEDFYSWELWEKAFSYIKDHIDQSYHVLDIGTGTGGMLQVFQRHGFKSLIGIDIDDKQEMMEAKGLGFIRGDIQSLPFINQSALFKEQILDRNLFILNGVLEHIFDVRAAMFSLLDTMKMDDLLFVMVPDADEYPMHFDKPYRYFGMEHINHFNERTLRTLFEHYGFAVLEQGKFNQKLNRTSSEPDIYALIRKKPIIKDILGRRNALAYIEKSRMSEAETANTIGVLIDKGTPLIIWGMGSYFMSLCRKTKLMDANIKAFADNNTTIQGTKMNGIEIIAPETIKDYPDCCVCVVSAAYSDDILREIHQMGLPNEILVL